MWVWTPTPPRIAATIAGAFVLAFSAPRVPAQEPNPIDGAPSRLVNFQTDDGFEIVGDFFEAPKSDRPAPAALLVHMFRTDRSTWKPLIHPLRRAGFAVLAFDLRGHGDSGRARADELKPRLERQESGVLHDMVKDLEAAHAWLLREPGVDKTRVVIAGASVGASIALEYASQDRSIDGLALLTPGTGYMGFDSVTPIMRYGARPVLLVSVEDDRRAVDLLTQMNPGATSHVEGRGTGHGTRIFEVVPGMPERVTGFLRKSAGEPSGKPVVSTLSGDVYFRDAGKLRKSDKSIKDSDLRWYSSAEEAEARGLKRGK